MDFEFPEVFDEEQALDEDMNIVGDLVLLHDVSKISTEQISRLTRNDVNNVIQIEAESGDSDMEEEPDESALGKVKLIRKYDRDVLTKVFCVTQSYVIVETADDNQKNPLCQYCFFLHQYYAEVSSTYNHVNTHVKKEIIYSVYELECTVCKKKLYQVTHPEVCLICNKGKELDLQNYVPIIHP